MHVIILSSPPIGFAFERIAALPDLSYLTLDSVGALHRPLWVSDETANVTFTLSNGNGAMTSLFANPPLGKRAQIVDGGRLIFTGTVSAVTLAEVITVTLEA